MRKTPWILVFVALLGACALAPSAPNPAAAPHTPRILVTNDDGIESAGIAALAAALKPLGEVVVVAPAKNQSGASHSITILSGLAEIKPVMRDGALFGHSVSGTPADAVLTALYWTHRGAKFDLVVSGINYGTNVGIASHYSGTVGATVEAVLAGIPGIAFSQDAKLKDDYARSAAVAAGIVEQALKNRLAPGVFLNVNIPHGELKGIKVLPDAGSYYIVDRVDPVGAATDGSTGLKPRMKIGTEFPPGSDTEAYAQGYVTIAPLQVDWTDRPALKAVAKWPLALPAPAAPAAP